MKQENIKLKDGTIINLKSLGDAGFYYSISENQIIIYDLNLDNPHIFTGEIKDED